MECDGVQCDAMYATACTLIYTYIPYSNDMYIRALLHCHMKRCLYSVVTQHALHLMSGCWVDNTGHSVRVCHLQSIAYLKLGRLDHSGVDIGFLRTPMRKT